MRVTPENNPQRPTQHLEYDPIKKMKTEPEAPATPGTASKALGTVTSMAEKIQQLPMIAHLIRATERFNDRMGNQFGAAITLIQPVDDGIYVGTEQGLVFLAGTEFDSLQYVPLLPEPVVLGSGVAVRGDMVALGEGRGNGAAMLCIVGGCVIAGFNSGSVNRLTHQRYRTAAREVAATFREVDGMPQYIAIPH